MLDADDHFTFTVVLKHLVGVGDVAMLIDQRITGVAPQKFDRHVELVFSPHAVACGGHFRAMIDSVGPGKDRNLGFYRVLQHRKPFDAQIQVPSRTPELPPFMPTLPVSTDSMAIARAVCSPLEWRCGPQPWQM